MFSRVITVLTVQETDHKTIHVLSKERSPQKQFERHQTGRVH